MPSLRPAMRTRSSPHPYIASGERAGLSYYNTNTKSTRSNNMSLYSLRLLAIFAFATVVALPATDKPETFPRPVTTITDDDFVDDSPWFSFPLFGNLFAPLWRLFPSFTEIGPRIIADDDKFQVIVNVKEYKKDELKVRVKGIFLLVQGSRLGGKDDHDSFASQFFHTYTLPTNASATDVTAEVSSDGFLIVTAPLNGGGKGADKIDRDVTIVESGKPFDDGKTVPTEKNTSPAPVSEIDEDRKEPTTPSDRELVTENTIPHGNDDVTP